MAKEKEGKSRMTGKEVLVVVLGVAGVFVTLATILSGFMQ